MLPGFHEIHFPFIVLQRKSGISIVNLRQSYMELLVEYATGCTDPQPAFFFKEEEYGMSLHFTAPRDLENGQTRMKWIQMRFAWEFYETLKTYGQLPISNIQQALKLQEEHYQLKKFLSQSKQGAFFLKRFEENKHNLLFLDEQVNIRKRKSISQVRKQEGPKSATLTYPKLDEVERTFNKSALL